MSLFFTAYTFIFSGLKHRNICPFVGVIRQTTHITGLLYQYCSRGTLRELLLNSHIDFNKSFRFSFSMDAIRGLSYLHAQKITHGRVKTSNCVIDQHWVLKLTGRSEEREGEGEERERGKEREKERER